MRGTLSGAAKKRNKAELGKTARTELVSYALTFFTAGQDPLIVQEMCMADVVRELKRESLLGYIPHGLP